MTPRYYPKKIWLATLGLALALICLGYQGAIGREINWGLVVPLLLIYSVIVIKFAAPDVPWAQVLLCCASVLLVNCVADWINWPPGYLIADLIVEIALVFGFGAHWVRCKYIPFWANRW